VVVSNGGPFLIAMPPVIFALGLHFGPGIDLDAIKAIGAAGK